MAAFCRFWRMTPREVDELSPEEWRAFTAYQTRENKETQRAMRKRG